MILSGNAEPYVPSGQLPIDGPLRMFGWAAAPTLADALVVN